VMTMGVVVQEMIQTAMQALVSRDKDLVTKVNELEDQVDRFQVEIDDDVVRLMTVYGPVAIDLRFILMTTRINTELERIGDQTVNTCENVELLLSEPEMKTLTDLPRMSDTAARMVKESLEAFVEKSTTKAAEVIKMDGEVDALDDQIFRELLTYMIKDPENITCSLALLLTSRSLERIADHATNIAEEVIYMVKGEDIRHPSVMHPDTSH